VFTAPRWRASIADPDVAGAIGDDRQEGVGDWPVRRYTTFADHVRPPSVDLAK
jgi:hypothetical protein